MATIINNPSDTRPVVTSDDSSGVGLVVGLLVALVLIVLFVMYVLPSINGSTAPATSSQQPAGASANLNVTVPSGSTGSGSTGSGSTGSTNSMSGTVNSGY